MSQLLFDGKTIGFNPQSFAESSPTLRHKRTEVWGVNGELVMTGGLGGRAFSFVVIVKGKTKQAVKDALDSAQKLLGKVGKVQIIGSRTVENDTYKDCLFLPFIRPSSPIPDVVGQHVPSGWIAVDVVFNFYQLRVE